MNNILDFIKNNYLIFVIISVILIFALIGYLIERHHNKDMIVKTDNKEESL